MYAVMVGIAAAVVLCVSLDFKPPAKSLIKDIKVVLKNVELDVFFLVHFMSGKCKLGPHYDQHTLMYLPSKFHPIPTIGWIFVEFYWPSSWGFWQVRGWAEFRIQFPPTGIDSSLPLVNKLNARRCFNFQKKKKTHLHMPTNLYSSDWSVTHLLTFEFDSFTIDRLSSINSIFRYAAHLHTGNFGLRRTLRLSKRRHTCAQPSSRGVAAIDKFNGRLPAGSGRLRHQRPLIAAQKCKWPMTSFLPADASRIERFKVLGGLFQCGVDYLILWKILLKNL